MTKTNKNLEKTIDYNGMMILSGFKIDKFLFFFQRVETARTASRMNETKLAVSCDGFQEI